MKKIKLMIILLFAISLVTGCVTGTRSLENLDVPEYSNDKTAAGEVYIASITDQRVFEQKPRDPSTPSVKGDLSTTSKETLSSLIGRQRNGYGAAMGDVALPENVSVQDKVRELVTEGLEGRGYKVVDNENAANQISIDINKFWAWFSPGFASVSFQSNVECKIDFEQAVGRNQFNVKGYGINKGQIASNANWELAFQRAFQDFLKNLDATLDEANL